MITVKMATTHCWFHGAAGNLTFFESCEGAVRDLLERGISRDEIVIDYESETRKTAARRAAARYVEAYGKDGRRFMPHGVLLGVERPTPQNPEPWRYAMRKRVLNCPHCGKPIRATDFEK